MVPVQEGAGSVHEEGTSEPRSANRQEWSKFQRFSKLHKGGHLMQKAGGAIVS